MTEISLPRRLILCADDYGLSPAVSAGIRSLAEAGRLSATGAMTCMPAWAAEAPALVPLADRLDVGLHFTLSDQEPLGAMPQFAPAGRFPSLPRLLRLAFSGTLPGAEIAAELDRQLDAFEAHFGRAPAFIDGHHHVHLLPGVRDAVLGAFGRRLDPARCWLRDCTDAPAKLVKRGCAGKAAFIAALGLGLRELARRRGLRLNHGFSGFYDPCSQTLGDAFPKLVLGAEDGHLVMVHPGHVDAALRAVDSLVEPREAEWSFLIGDDLPVLLAARGLSIAAGLPAAA